MRQKINLAILLWLSACAGTQYQKLGVGGGYSDKIVSPDRWEITFKSNVASEVGFAEKAAVYRAAEIAKLRGFAYMAIVNGDVSFTVHAIATANSIGYSANGGQTAHVTVVGKQNRETEIVCEAQDKRMCTTLDTVQTLHELGPIIRQAGHRNPIE